jgi:phenylglyoxylate dehydrogenase beta subunit
MGKGYKTIAFRADKCDGCKRCVDACAQFHVGKVEPEHSRIQVARDKESGAIGLALCRQCGEPACVTNCPASALVKDLQTGVVHWDETRCVACQLCTLACPYGGSPATP